MSSDVIASEDNGAAPPFMYLHYLVHGSENPPFPVYLIQLQGPIDVQTVQKAVQKIIANKISPINEGNAPVEWRTASYMVFVLNGAGAKLNDIDFKFQGVGPNKTFYDKVDLGTFDTCSAVCYTNRRLNQQGDPLGINERELYKWKAIHSMRSKALPESIETHTSSGTNVGP